MAQRCHRPQAPAVMHQTWWHVARTTRGMKIKVLDVMKKYVAEGLRREEILDHLRRDFSQYPWSFRTFDRCFRSFGLILHQGVNKEEQLVTVGQDFSVFNVLTNWILLAFFLI